MENNLPKFEDCWSFSGMIFVNLGNTQDDNTSQANAMLERMHRVIRQMLHTAEMIWPNQLPLMMLMSSLTVRHGQFALPIIQYLKPHQVKLFLDETCSLTFRLWLTGTKLENTGNH